MNSENPGLTIWEQQTPLTLNQATPVQNTFYTIGSIVQNARIYNVTLNVEDANETLEFRTIVDGQTTDSVAVACTHSTIYVVIKYDNAVTRVPRWNMIAEATINPIPAFIIEGRSVQLQVRKTTNLGGGNLTGLATYGVKKQA